MQEITRSIHGAAIAIVGAAGRFPRARNLDEFWQRLRAGEELVTFFSDEELLAAGVDANLLGNPAYVKARAVIEEAEYFDAAFFGYSPREAEVLDPQQRIFLECAWEALENAGYDAERYEGGIGVYAGTSMNSYLYNNLATNPAVLDAVGGYQLMLANDKDFIATRVSYKLNLRGPSVNVQTACSTSLVAVQMACQSLLNYQCDIALAGGVSVGTPRQAGYIYQPGMILSPDGHCRTFDARGQGIVAGEGVGIVVLKRLSDALADGDHILAVIRGAAINNDGAAKVGYTAPSVSGQAEVIAMAQALAHVDPATIDYVEAHGTATELGDPVEIAALTQAFRISATANNFCAIGSVKSNMGHLDAAAGVAGLLKTVLALQHRQIPPSLHFTAPNPKIDFANSPFYVNTTLRDWPMDDVSPRRAGVSSFGIGGTNTHVVLEEAPTQPTLPTKRPAHLLLLSAQTLSALDHAATTLAAHLANHPQLDIADAAYTLQVGRKAFAARRFLVCKDREQAVTRLSQWATQAPAAANQTAQRQPVAFLFTGQGAQYVQMARTLYDVEPRFRDQVDSCAELLKPHLGVDLRTLLYPAPDQEEAATAQLGQTRFTQPALFVIEYALAKLWMALGVQPEAMLGHSIGEYVAACLAGVFSLEDALQLVAARGRMMQGVPGGSMVAVTLSESGIRPYLHAGLDLAAINTPTMCVVSGADLAIDALQARLEAQGIACRRLHTSHAFHSVMMDSILDDFAAQVAKVSLNAPELPYVSNVSGTWITAEQATDPRYWAVHLRATVRFAEGVAELFDQPGRILLEVGPGHTLSTLVKQHPARHAAQPVFSSLPHPYDATPDYAYWLNTVGNLWVAGAEIDVAALYGEEKRRRVPLPTYPFERQRYWVEPQVSSIAAARTAQHAHLSGTSSQLLLKRPDMNSWYYVPSWKRSDLPPTLPQAADGLSAHTWLIFIDNYGLGAAVAAKLQAQGAMVTRVEQGATFTRQAADCYSLPPQDKDSYETLFAELRRADRRPDRILHLWNVAPIIPLDLEPDELVKAQDLGFYSLLYVAQALGQPGMTGSVKIDVIASGLHDIIGDEKLAPAKATLLGPCRVIPQEYPQVTCRSVDIVWTAESRVTDELVAQLWCELTNGISDTVVAYRGRHRWVQTLEPIALAQTTQLSPLLRSQGVYLITGGLGGIGLALAEYLAQTVQARLVLTARSVLPERNEWEQWLATHAADEPLSRKLRILLHLETLGAEVLVVAADVTNRAQMQLAVEQAKSRFGTIHGLIHGAGMAGGGIIPLKTRDMAERVLAAKVVGTVVTDSVLAETPLDFEVLCSSFTSILGGAGQVDYCAANAFLDAFAHAYDRRGKTRYIAMNWAVWQEVGMAVETEVPEHLRHAKAENLRNGLLTREGQEAFMRILAQPLPQIVVSPLDFVELIRRATNGVDADVPDQARTENTSLEFALEGVHTTHARPHLSTAYVPPRSDTEVQIAAVWQMLLGIDEIGIHDNFFELGGHSLLITQMIVRLQARFGIELSMRNFFEAQTIAELSEQVDILLWTAEAQDTASLWGEGDREEVEF